MHFFLTLSFYLWRNKILRFKIFHSKQAGEEKTVHGRKHHGSAFQKKGIAQSPLQRLQPSPFPNSSPSKLKLWVFLRGDHDLHQESIGI